jgi:hypothetical protein
MTPPSSPEKLLAASAQSAGGVDMSPEAIDRRLREVGRLWELWRYLRKFRPVEKKTPPADDPRSVE